jgi:hypothetical protein
MNPSECNRRSWIKPGTVLAFVKNRVFSTDALFIRRENTVRARERATLLGEA